MRFNVRYILHASPDEDLDRFLPDEDSSLKLIKGLIEREDEKNDFGHGVGKQHAIFEGKSLNTDQLLHLIIAIAKMDEDSFDTGGASMLDAESHNGLSFIRRRICIEDYVSQKFDKISGSQQRKIFTSIKSLVTDVSKEIVKYRCNAMIGKPSGNLDDYEPDICNFEGTIRVPKAYLEQKFFPERCRSCGDHLGYEDIIGESNEGVSQ